MGSSSFIFGICLEEGEYHMQGVRNKKESVYVNNHVDILCYNLVETKAYLVFFSARPTRPDTSKQQKR